MKMARDPGPGGLAQVGPKVDPLGAEGGLERGHAPSQPRPQLISLLLSELADRPDMPQGNDHQVAARVRIGVEHGEHVAPDPEHTVAGARRAAGGDAAEDAVRGVVEWRGVVVPDRGRHRRAEGGHVPAPPPGPQLLEAHGLDSGTRRSAISRSSCSVKATTSTPRTGRSLPPRLTPPLPAAPQS